ncbi:hypothetical protein OPV22_017440 [Ensete ventricosum]|uniref:Protein kinase domain-containing protein n=1 Tax=Ensete ventricosum TaxID=4639 RepID=A0AAV8QTS3_ENSVE|nr:hypothetical protein OPV22_017440 [Ensete ventricosum]
MAQQMELTSTRKLGEAKKLFNYELLNPYFKLVALTARGRVEDPLIVTTATLRQCFSNVGGLHLSVQVALTNLILENGWVWLKVLSFGSVPRCFRFALLWFVRCTYPGSNRMGWWWRRVLFPWLLCALVVLLAIHGSKGPYFKRQLCFQRMLLQMRPGLPISNIKMEIKTFEMLDFQSPALGSYISPSPDLATMVPRIKEKAPPPMHLSEPHFNYAPSPSIVTEGSVLNSPTVLPKSEVLPPTIQAVVPSMQPSAPPDHVAEAEKPRMRPSVQGPAPDVPVSTSISSVGVPEADFHGKTPDNSSPVAATVAQGPAVSPTSFSSPAIHGNRDGMPVAASPKINQTSLSNYSHPKVPAVSPSSLTSPAVSWNRHSVPVPAPQMESSSHLSPTNYSQPKGLAVSPSLIPSPNSHSDSHGAPVAAPPEELSNHGPPDNHLNWKGYPISPISSISPDNHERNNGKSVAPPPKYRPKHSIPVNYSHPKGPATSPLTSTSPAISSYGVPVAAPPKTSSNHSTHIIYSHPKRPAMPPVAALSPAIHENHNMPVAGPPEDRSNHSTSLNYSYPKVPAMSPLTATPPATSERHGMPVASPPKEISSHISPVNHPHLRGSFPVISPAPHEVEVSSDHTRAPNSSHPHPPTEKVPDSPSPMAVVPSHQFTPGKGKGNPSSAPSPLLPSEPYHPALPPKLRPKVHAPPPYAPVPLHSIDSQGTPAPAQSIVAPFTHNRGHVQFPVASPSRSIHSKPMAPKMQPIHALPPPPPSLDCTPRTCYDPLTNSRPGSPCKFRCASWEQMLPVFINSSYFGDYEVLYVRYPGLPPSPPTAPGNININDGSYGNDNNSRTIHPLAVDVRRQKEKQNHSLVAVLAISAVIAFILCVGAVWLLLLKCRAGSHLPQTPQALTRPLAKASGIGPTMLGSRQTSASASFSSSMQTYAGSVKTFSLAEMEKATNRFDDLKIIGEGGFGRVYEGTLEDGTRVAIKVLKRDDQEGNREFLAEVEMLSRLHHRNLIKLLGICTEEHNCLVYELVPSGSVESHLHGADKETAVLNWNTRLKIALGAARGLAYLHEDSSPRVIHRDFKSSNILLEDDFTPKVSDFGLARTAMGEGNEYISTRVMGTFGYVAPEYAMTGHLLVKSDVYSYGVVLLELLTGRKPVDMLRPPGQENLVTWARPLLTSRDGLESIIDPSLGNDIPFDSLAKVAAIASMCVQPEVDQRPFMGEVVQALKLVYNEGDDCRVSENFSPEETSTLDKEPRISGGWDMGSDTVLSESEILNVSARFTRDASSSFHRYSSSGPLRPGRSQQFWHRVRGLTSGSASEHGTFDKGLEAGDQWV